MPATRRRRHQHVISERRNDRRPCDNRSISVAGGTITASTTSGAGSNITLDADRSSLFIDDRSTIAATANGAGNAVGTAGNISLNAADLVTVRDSTVTARANSPGNAVIRLDPRFVVLDASTIVGTVTASKKDVKVDIEGNLFSSQSRIESNNVAILPPVDLAGALTPLPSAFYSQFQPLPDVCGIKLGGELSSFIITGQEGIAPIPGGWQPDPPVQGPVEKQKR